jgi:hypothetical protein
MLTPATLPVGSRFRMYPAKFEKLSDVTYETTELSRPGQLCGSLRGNRRPHVLQHREHAPSEAVG